MIDHDDSQVIGRVHELVRLDWVDGPWVAARATVTAPPPMWLKPGTTKASFGSFPGSVSEWNIRGTRAEVSNSPIVLEVSVLGPATKPAEPLAEVLSIRPAEVSTRSQAVVRPDCRAAAGEVIIHGEQRIIRRGVGQVLGVR